MTNTSFGHIGNINLTTAGGWNWTIAIPDSNLAANAKYVLRFQVATAQYDPRGIEIHSAGFLVIKGDQPWTVTGSQSRSGELSTGSQVGIAVGITIIGLLLIALLFVVFKYVIVGRQESSKGPPLDGEEERPFQASAR